MLTLKAPDASAPISQYINTDPVTFGPNVTGTTGDLRIMYSSLNIQGAFSAVNIGQQAFRGGNTIGTVEKLNFNASSSNSIYTDNGHVYLLSCALNFIIKC